jgi:DNA-binding transcriptional regulator YdaS (Cro superfamily)
MTDVIGRYSSPVGALRAAVDRIGGQNATARLLKVAQPSVWRWLTEEKPLPAQHVLLVEAATGISRYDLRPDIFSRPSGPVSDVAR